ncbi:metallophosphoesterase family protein [Natranaerofaba carboxydovora]|uniref:metallophosphoesterase family protein n=1 Tax=Natranaerofaba carboxydovora TaxID=2742683 RepID=UPI001F144229|nr:metallophosphoesterase [Natranaerofaba carboxydovora]UMZ73671.1 putative metallophosphoesterase YhaO [Natranaerofaba carboxydovora]
MRKCKFIHAADLHLGTPLQSSYNLPEELSKILQEATYDALEGICDLAIYHDVDFIIFSGDVFDQEARSIRALEFFKKQINKLKENKIFVYMIGGNHDPINKETISFFKDCENLWIFGSDKAEEKDFLTKDNLLVRVIGQSYRSRADSRKMANCFNPVDDFSFNIGVVHTQLDPHNNNYVPCSLTELKSKKDIDYWALGHIHKGKIISDNKPTVVYPGTPQGRHVGEEGPRYCVLVTAEDKNIKDISFLLTSPVIWYEIEVSIDESYKLAPKNIVELEELLISKIEEINDINKKNIKGHMIRWVITGKTSLHEQLEEQQDEVKEKILDTLRRKFLSEDSFVWSDSILFRTNKPLPSVEKLKKQSEIFGYLDELARECLTDNSLKNEIIKELGEVWEWESDHENYNEDRLQLNEEILSALIEQAKEHSIESLLERREKN